MEKFYFIVIILFVIQTISNLIFKKFILDYLEDLKKIMTEEVKEPTEILGFKDNTECKEKEDENI